MVSAVQRAFIKKLDSPEPSIRAKAVEAIISGICSNPETPSDQLWEAVRSGLHDSSPMVRTHTAQYLYFDSHKYLRSHGGKSNGDLEEVLGGTVAHALVTNIGDADADVRKWSIVATGSWGIQDATEVLISATSDRSKDVRMAAIEALGNMKVVQSIDSLIALMEDPDIDIQKEAIAALSGIESDDAR